MGQFTLNAIATIRKTNMMLTDINFSYGVTQQSDDITMNTEFGVSDQLRKLANNPEWTQSPLTGHKHYFAKHNNFRDQELHDRKISCSFDRRAHAANYYVCSYDPSGDPIWHEDNIRDLTRVFEVRIQMELQEENELYQKLGITGLDQVTGRLHMTSFLRANHQNMIEIGIEATEDPELHNPILYQRGYSDFNYHGYKAADIIPKTGDLIKLEAYNTLYQIESVTDADPTNQFRYRKYFWKVSMSEYRDDGKLVSDDVKDSELNRGFVDDMFGQSGVYTADNEGEGMNTSLFDVSPAIDKLKGDVLFRPVQVPEEVKDITKDARSYPGFSNYGGW